MKKKMNHPNPMIISIVLVILIILTLLYMKLYMKLYKTDTFANLETPTNPSLTIPSTTKLQPIDRTKLYGSLFLENIEQSIKNFTDNSTSFEDIIPIKTI